jgi:hypothetical protein
MFWRLPVHGQTPLTCANPQWLPVAAEWQPVLRTISGEGCADPVIRTSIALSRLRLSGEDLRG